MHFKMLQLHINFLPLFFLQSLIFLISKSFSLSLSPLPKMALQIGKSSGASFTDLLKEGYQHLEGLEEAIFSNIKACNELTSLTRTSLGPNARNKIVINHLDRMFLTSDTATILGELEVVHPAAKLLILAAKQQQAQFGDQTNSMLALAGSLLNEAEVLLRKGIKVADVIRGYEMSLERTLQCIPELIVGEVADWHSESEVAKVVYGAVCTKQQGLESVLVPLVVKACIAAMPQEASKFSSEFLKEWFLRENLKLPQNSFLHLEKLLYSLVQLMLLQRKLRELYFWNLLNKFWIFPKEKKLVVKL
jgi:hypothetical protein